MGETLWTDRPVPDTFAEGWALDPMAHGKAHRYHRVTTIVDEKGRRDVWHSLCDRARAVTYEMREHDGYHFRKVTLFEPGNFPKCHYCARAVQIKLRHHLPLPTGRPHLALVDNVPNPG